VHLISHTDFCRFLFCFSGGASKADDAAELYVKAGNSFKMAKNWSGTYTELFT